MNKRLLRILGLLAALGLVFIIGAAAGGGAVFAATKSISPYHQEVVIPAQDDGEPGIVIASVVPDGPADQAGVKRGDILLKMDDQAIEQSRDVVSFLGDREPGDQVELTVLHGDEERTLTATLGDRNGQPYLGVVPCGGLPGEPEIVALRIAGPGARVIEVVPDSPADDAGLEVGDLITSVDGQNLDAENSLADLIAGYAPGETVTLEVTSPGQEAREVSVQLSEHPDDAGKAYLGVQYLPMPGMHRFEGQPLPFGRPGFGTPPLDDQLFFALPEGDFEGGAVVGRVADDSPAQAAGLERGDVITALDDQPVDGPQAVVDAVGKHQPGDVIKLTVYRPQDDQTMEVQVTLAEHPEGEGTAYLGVHLGGVFVTPGFEGERGMPGDRGRRFEFRLPFNRDELPFDFKGVPNWFHFEMPPGDCCGDGESTLRASSTRAVDL